MQVPSLYPGRFFRLVLKTAGFQESVVTCARPHCSVLPWKPTLLSRSSKDLPMPGSLWEVLMQMEVSAFFVISHTVIE